MIRREFLKVLSGLPFLGFLRGEENPKKEQVPKEIFLGSGLNKDGLGVKVPYGYVWRLTRYETRGDYLYLWGYSTKKESKKP